MVRLTIEENGDKVQIQEEVAAKYDLKAGDTIGLALWHELITRDFDEIMARLSGDLLSDSQQLILEKWQHTGRKYAGIDNLDYNSLLLCILRPKAADQYMLLLSAKFLMEETNLISNFGEIMKGHSDRNTNTTRQMYFDALDKVPVATRKVFNELCNKYKNQTE